LRPEKSSMLLAGKAFLMYFFRFLRSSLSSN
jgi:hypothetical protein